MSDRIAGRSRGRRPAGANLQGRPQGGRRGRRPANPLVRLRAAVRAVRLQVDRSFEGRGRTRSRREKSSTFRAGGTIRSSSARGDQTFQAKEVERSNSMLITNLSSPPANCEAQEFRKLEVFSIVNRNFELTEGPLCKPPKFRELLNARLLNPFDEEPEFPTGFLSIQQFMSAMPLCEGTHSMFCLSADGREELMREFAGFLDDRGSADEAIRRSDLENSAIFSEVATRFSSTVVSSLIDWMLAAFFNTEDDGDSFRLNVERTGREFCSHVLRRRAWGTKVERHFYRLVPAFMRFDQKFLRGIAVYKKKTRSSVQYVCSDNLPLDAKQRLDELWKHADSWALEDIQPYILDFVGDPALVFEFLAARCRVSNVDGQPHFFRL
ncbi:Sister chromatid cohesion protein DCC1 [Aphelenchoides fujianensis]|nr:Sister chromatid cohesion protein DCC1 [Aphelenchoides fujianensis]